MKIDLTKEHKQYYAAKNTPEIIEIAPAQFLSIEGKGDPSAQEYADLLQALYATAYAVKFIYKGLEKDFVVAKLEGLWWFDENKYSGFGISDAPQKIPRNEWSYRMLIRVPNFVTDVSLKKAVETVTSKKGIALASSVELFKMNEGKSVQMLHIGPFSKEPETLQIMNQFMQEKKLQRNGLHHEIYLSDFRKTPEEKLKTILREPVR
ncbi:hypothetical protein D3C80_465660 [compost metagenome]